ncbi:hypothetical protein JW935_25440, partial [candidate division KSB1 bacterium]|nr:hypothetical protein [candidate division KSB1 bacterium]
LNLLKKEEGSIFVLTAFCLLILVLVAAFTIDISRTFVARNELQSAVDAAVLAGASGFVINNYTAFSRAIEFAGYNTINNQPLILGYGEITFPSRECIRISVTRSVPTAFAGFMGVRNMNIRVSGAAELEPIVASRGLRPLCVPDEGWYPGTPVVIKEGMLGIDLQNNDDDPSSPDLPKSFHFPVCYPPLNRGNPEEGANQYSIKFKYGSDNNMVWIGDELLVEPGNMQGPTKQSVGYLIGLDPGAYWSHSRVLGSAYAVMESPRIIHLPLYDPDDPPELGRTSLIVTGFAAFFLLGMEDDGDVIGIFMKNIAQGKTGNNPVSLLRGIKLVE